MNLFSNTDNPSTSSCGSKIRFNAPKGVSHLLHCVKSCITAQNMSLDCRGNIHSLSKFFQLNILFFTDTPDV